MQYICLLRGINVGGNNLIEMKRLRAVFEKLGYREVKTYINSGNVFFISGKKKAALKREIEEAIGREWKFVPGTLIKELDEVKVIKEGIPESWGNNEEEKTDVAYLFPDIDYEEILSELPIDTNYVEVKYIRGALILHRKRSNNAKGTLHKLIGHALYQSMTLRNIHTARYLASW